MEYTRLLICYLNPLNNIPSLYILTLITTGL